MSLSNQFYKLWKPALRSRIEIVPENLPGLAGGHYSAYSFDSDTASAIGVKSNEEIKKAALWKSTELILDIENPEQVEEVKDKLKGDKIGYKLYKTGGNGVHFHIPRDNSPDNRLPYSDLTWVISQNIPADRQIYHLFHTIRNIGAIHEKTNNRKALFEEYISEKAFAVPLVENKVISQEEVFGISGTSIFSDILLTQALSGFSHGRRYEGMMWLAGRLAKFKLMDPQAYFILDQVSKACLPKFDQLESIWRYYQSIRMENVQNS